MQAHQPSRVGRQRPPCAWKSHASNRTRVYHTNMPDLARTFCAHSRPIPIRDQCQLEVGWARVARAVSLAPTMSGDFSRSNARGRSDLHSPNDAWTSQAHESPGMLQDRRGMSAASSPFRQTASLASQRPVAREFASRSTDWAGRVQAYASTLEIRAKRRELGGPADRQAPIFRQESEGGIRRRMRRQPGG